jgi:hypothetical protein
MSEKLSEFYKAVQVGLQHNIHHVLEEVDPLVEEAQASIGDLSFCFGSVFASILFELIREGEETMTEEQEKLIVDMVEPLIVGFTEKVKLLVKPDVEKMEVIRQ